jgi:DNA-binding IclR family transcriptional regulator
MRTAHWDEPVSVLDRIIAVLEAVRQAQGTTTISRISRSTGIPKSTVSRLVGHLVEQRHLVRVDGDVAVGVRLFELGARVSIPRRLRAAALPVLAELHRATGEHLNVAVRDGVDMLTILSVRGRLRPAPSRAGVRVPSATTALGKAFIAFSSDTSLVQGVTMNLDANARRDFERELADVRSTSVAVDLCDTFPGVVGVASPVLGHDHTPVAAISVAGPVSDMDPGRMGPIVRHAAIALTRRLQPRAA